MAAKMFKVHYLESRRVILKSKGKGEVGEVEVGWCTVVE